MNLACYCEMLVLLVCSSQVNGHTNDTSDEMKIFNPNRLVKRTSPSRNIIDNRISNETILTWPNGDRYEGECFQGKRHGFGVFKYADGRIYAGDWFNDTKAGKGVMIWHNGDRYDGQFENDTMHGQGTYQFTNGANYVGSWINGKRSGQGVMTWADDTKYDGYWVNDERTGQGNMLWPDGENYDGEFVNGKKHGLGTNFYSDGTTYNGAWINDTRYGQGILTFANGTKYTGFWIDDHQQPPGVFIFSNGHIYQGDWINDRGSGRGNYTWPNNEKYDGDWIDGRRHGTGTMFYADGANYTGTWIDDTRAGKGVLITYNREKYDGDWIDDKRTGMGVYTWPNGEKYEGEWLDGKRHGTGKIHFVNGAIYTGAWLNDKMSGHGIMIWRNNHKYEGEFYNGRMHGQGTYFFADGRKYDDTWINGRGSDKFETILHQQKQRNNFLSDEKPQSTGLNQKMNNTTNAYHTSMHTQLNGTSTHGENYDGEFMNGKRHGSGKNHYIDGGIYAGNWINDKRSGKGKMTWPNGNIYEGDWIDDKRHGTGTIHYVDGRTYTGNWNNDKRSGRGVLTWTDGQRCNGIWIDDKPSCTVTRPGVKSSYSSVLIANNFDANGTRSYLYFMAIEVTASLNGTYTFIVNNGTNIYGFLYNHLFNANRFQSNVIATDDSIFSETHFQLKANLTTDQLTILVITTNQTLQIERLNVDVYGPASVTLKPACLRQCLNGGKCLSANSCSCTASWTGSRCETPIIRAIESKYSSALTTRSFTFARPNQDESGFFFVAIKVSASTSGIYTMVANSSMDTYGCLYNAPFNPNSPLSNLIETDDDNGPESNFRFSTALTTNRSILLVVTTYRPSQTGAFSIIVYGQNQVTFEERTLIHTCTNGMNRGNDNTLIVIDTKGQKYAISNRYGWSMHNCDCKGQKTGLVLYPADTSHKNVVLLLCETCYDYQSNAGTRYQQLVNWYYNMYGTSKQFSLMSGFDVKTDGSIQFNSWSQNGRGLYTSNINQMNVCEQDVIRKVINGQLHSYAV